MSPVVNKAGPVNGLTAAHPTFRPLDLLAKVLAKVGLLRHDADYHLLRGAIVIIFFFFGYQKWFS